jgi:IclR family transcriptional regulator, pca regulon regulatory protein
MRHSNKVGARPTEPARAATRTPDIASEKNYIAALGRGLSVIRSFTRQRNRLTLAEISKLVDLPRATVRRCLLTLNALGYVEAQGKYFQLTPQVLTLSQAYFSSSPLPFTAQPHIERVSEATGESCSISVLTGDEVVYIARSSRRRQASLHREIGVNLPAYCTSMGRVLLANMEPDDLDLYFSRADLKKFNHKTIIEEAALRKLFDHIRKTDYAVVDGELEPDLRAIAIPVRDSAGQIVAALNVSTSVNRMTVRQMESQLLPVMRQAAAKIRNALVG